MQKDDDDLTRVVDLLLGQAPRLGRTRLVCVDGPAGSGKTTLAARLEERVREAGPSVVVVHMDDLYEGWTALGATEDRLQEWVLAPLSQGREAAYRRYDWESGAYAEWHVVPAVDVLVLEGVGSGCGRHADHITLLVWVEAPADLRRERGLERDGAALAEHWRRWMTEEARFHAQDGTRDRADVVVDGVTGRVSGSVGRRRPEARPAGPPPA